MVRQLEESVRQRAEIRRQHRRQRSGAPAKDDLKKKKDALIEAQNDLDFAKKIYDLKRENAANQDDEVKKAQKLLSDSGASSTSDSLYIYRAALADLEKKINNAGAKWAGIDEGKAEMNKVHDAEKELDKAKRRLEAVRKVRRKESRFESENYLIFSY